MAPTGIIETMEDLMASARAMQETTTVHAPPPAAISISISIPSRSCEHCKGSMEGKRHLARFCSDACKKAARRNRMYYLAEPADVPETGFAERVLRLVDEYGPDARDWPEMYSYLGGKRPGRKALPREHGTMRGYRQHERRDERACDACLEARRVHYLGSFSGNQSYSTEFPGVRQVGTTYSYRFRQGTRGNLKDFTGSGFLTAEAANAARQAKMAEVGATALAYRTSLNRDHNYRLREIKEKGLVGVAPTGKTTWRYQISRKGHPAIFVYGFKTADEAHAARTARLAEMGMTS